MEIMPTPYTIEQEFKFEITVKKLITIHTPIMGKRNCLFEILKSAENIYGLQTDLAILQAELGLTESSGEKKFQEIFSEENPDFIIKTLNLIYLQNNFYFLLLCLYHKSPLVRKVSFTLLCNGFEITPLVLSFFQEAFSFKDPYKILVFSENFKLECLTFLNRDTVRWVTSLFQQTSQDKIWQKYNAQEINQAIDSQKKLLKTIEKTSTFKEKVQTSNSSAIDFLCKSLSDLSQIATEAIADPANIKADKANNLKVKWVQAISKINTAHKFLERLFEKWDENKPSEFTNSFLIFLSYISVAERYMFFIYGASSEHLNIMTLSFRYITEISPINIVNIATHQKEANQFVKAIIQSKYYGESKNKQPLFRTVNEHFDELIIQLKEVEDIFIPIKNEIDIQSYVPTFDANAKVHVRKLNFPHQKGYFPNFYFEPKKSSLRFLKLEASEPSSALEIQAISGIAIILGENKTRTTALPVNLPEFEFNSRIAFKPSNKFDPKFYKANKNKNKHKKEKTLADIFGDASSENEKKENLLEQILNIKPKKEE